MIWLQSNGFSPCMNGNQLDTTCNAVVTATAINCSNADLVNLTGIQFFDNLDSLNFVFNDVGVLPGLPSGLEFLNSSYNNSLHYLPLLPNGLNELRCSADSLLGMPPLPDSLRILICTGYLNDSLPPLPDGLLHLNCENSALTVLPELPNGMTYLNCTQNNLTALPDLPDSLKILYCQNNEIAVMPDLPNGLTTLTCLDNQLTSLPALPDSLVALSCAHNQIGALPAIPNRLFSLTAYNNQITAVPALPNSLKSINLANNQIASMVNLPDTLFTLNLSGNPSLVCLPPFEVLAGSTFSIGNTGISCLPNLVSHWASVPVLDTMPICGVINVNGCPVGWNVAGRAFVDNNGNCSFDTTDGVLPYTKVSLLQGGNVIQQVYTNAYGQYGFNTPPTAVYTVGLDTASMPFILSCADTGQHTFDLDALGYVDGLDFSVVCSPGFDLTAVTTGATGAFFPGNPVNVNIFAGELSQYYSVSCSIAGLAGSVVTVVEGPVQIDSVSTGGTTSGDTVTWMVADFSAVDFSDFWIAFTVDTTAQSGDQVCVHAAVAASAGTENVTSNNASTHCFEVVNSYDPNIKEVYPAVGVVPGTWHTYTVHFQNTGTAPAMNILVKDTLDPNIDWSSFQLLAYSHNNLTQVLNDGIVHFNFPNIQLPDSNTNEPESHGFIQYKIKTASTITPGTSVHNTAAIYFDFNDPIITNDATVFYCTPVETQQTLFVCEGDSVQVNNQWLHQGGVYTNLYTAFSGCDSTVTTTLVVNPTVAFIENYVLCPGDSVTVNGAVFHQPVSFTDTTTGTNGCDVLLITNIVESPVDITIVFSNDTLAAAPAMAAYQWIDCGAGQPIAGATNQTFAPAQNGQYAVSVTSDGACTAVSDCLDVLVNGVEPVRAVAFTVAPNPASFSAAIRFARPVQHARLTVVDLSGRSVLAVDANGTAASLPLNGLAEGVYTVELSANGMPTGRSKLVVLR
ncbi:MAG TPA: T9SS type A sorting domain-containing protein [Chitinophagales bacterium]|nr:T9SS type A sorting domain-containing protein [Chitinophagales bacterium]